MSEELPYLEFREGDFRDAATDMLGGAVTLRSGDDSGNFDELVAKGVDLHIEMMNDGEMWVCMDDPRVPGARVVLWVNAKKRDKLSIAVDQETWETRPTPSEPPQSPA